MNRSSVLVLAFSLVAASSSADVITSTFEDLGLAPNSVNNSAPTGQFVSGGSSFNNNVDSFGDWYGWAISSSTNNSAPAVPSDDFLNPYGAITGTGAAGSATYAVAFTYPPVPPYAYTSHPAISFVDLPAGSSPLSVQVTNTTYAYYSMFQGDGFGKQFGPGDYFLLDVKGWSGLDGTGTVIGDVPFYLANFLNGNSYIINTWQTLNLASLAGAQSLQFGLQSTDNDPTFGMNTPAYFAIDNLQLSPVPEPAASVLALLGLAGVARLIASRRRSGSNSAITTGVKSGQWVGNRTNDL